MSKDFKDFVKIVGGMFIVIFIGCGVIMSPFVYLQGSAKSDWLKQSQNIEIPWYKAVFLNVNVQDINARIR